MSNTLRPNEVRRASEVLYDSASLRNTDITYENAPDVVMQLMELVQAMRHLRGEEKKQAVLGAVKLAIDANFDGVAEDVLMKIIPSMIDRIIDVDNGKIVIDPRIRSMFCCS